MDSQSNVDDQNTDKGEELKSQGPRSTVLSKQILKSEEEVNLSQSKLDSKLKTQTEKLPAFPTKKSI